MMPSEKNNISDDGYDGLKFEIENIPKGFVPMDSERGLRMDEYLKNHNM